MSGEETEEPSRGRRIEEGSPPSANGAEGDQAQAAGAADDAANRGDETDGLYEWIGMLAAGLGFFLTPVLTGPVAGYCAFRVRADKPAVAMLIGALVVLTAIFWVVVGLFVIGPNL